jgi:ankyrin repeat protein
METVELLFKEDFEKFEILITSFANAGSNINTKDKYGRTPLHYAAIIHNPLYIEVLLNAGADVDAQDCDGNTPLHLAMSVPLIDSCVALLAGGASLHKENFRDEKPHHQLPENYECCDFEKFVYLMAQCKKEEE